MNASQTTLSVASASGFPTTAFRIRIDDEQMIVTGGFGTNTWTVTRGANGTTAATHVTSQTVTGRLERHRAILWNATTKTLTVNGTIFIDGSASITNGTLNQYNGQATLYLSGVFYFNNSRSSAAASRARDCDFAAWNPNTEMLDLRRRTARGGAAGTGNGHPLRQQRPVPGRALRDERRRVRQQREVGRADRRRAP